MRHKARIGWSHAGRYRSTSTVRSEDTDDTRSHRPPDAQLWVGSTGIGQSSWEGLSTGSYEKAPVVVHDWRHTMVLHGHSCSCNTRVGST